MRTAFGKDRCNSVERHEEPRRAGSQARASDFVHLESQVAESIVSVEAYPYRASSTAFLARLLPDRLLGFTRDPNDSQPRRNSG